MLTEEMPSLALDNLLEWRNPLAEAFIPNEVSILQFILPYDISHIIDPVTRFFSTALCSYLFISSLPLSRFFHRLLRFFVHFSPFFTLPCFCLSGLNCFILPLSIFLYDFVEVWNQVRHLRHCEREIWGTKVSKGSERDLVRERIGLKVYEVGDSSVFKICLFIGQGLLCFH